MSLYVNLPAGASQEHSRSSLCYYVSRTVGVEILLRGNPANGGSATGRVKVVVRRNDLDKFEDGDVLVIPYGRVRYLALFGRAAAVVTDKGGITSHAAVLAREYGIPAVVRTGRATRLLVDGQEVLVDGDSGEVLSV